MGSATRTKVQLDSLPFSTGTMPCPDFDRTYRFLSLLFPPSLACDMEVTIQLVKIFPAWPPAPSCAFRRSSLAHKGETPSSLPSLIYGTGIKKCRNPFIISEYTSLMYGKPGFRTFHFPAISSLSCSPVRASATQAGAKINRHTGKLEHLVSHRKQRTGPQINRHISRGPCFSFSFFTFPFSNHQSRLSARAQCYNGLLEGAARCAHAGQPIDDEAASNHGVQRTVSGAEKRIGE
jgi:hypothetical protein